MQGRSAGGIRDLTLRQQSRPGEGSTLQNRGLARGESSHRQKQT